MSITKVEGLDVDRQVIAHGDTKAADGIQVTLGSRVVSVQREEVRTRVRPQDRNDVAALAAQMTRELQAAVDEPNMPVADLPLDDPDRTTDPALPNQFWQEIDGVMWSVARSALVTVSHDGHGFSMAWEVV